MAIECFGYVDILNTDYDAYILPGVEFNLWFSKLRLFEEPVRYTFLKKRESNLVWGVEPLVKIERFANIVLPYEGCIEVCIYCAQTLWEDTDLPFLPEQLRLTMRGTNRPIITEKQVIALFPECGGDNPMPYDIMLDYLKDRL